DLEGATLWLMQNGAARPDNAGAAAYPYMQLMGLVCLGLMWLRIGLAATRERDASKADRQWLDAKLIKARFFAERILPDSVALRRKIESGADSVMLLPAEAF